MFDPELPPQSTAWVEFTIVDPPRLATTYFNVRVAEGCRDLSMTVAFDPARRPRRCWAFRKASARDTEQSLGELTGNRAGTAYQLARIDPVPGIYGIRWEFSAAPPLRGA